LLPENGRLSLESGTLADANLDPKSLAFEQHWEVILNYDIWLDFYM
jgi:hypothetical protein